MELTPGDKDNLLIFTAALLVARGGIDELPCDPVQARRSHGGRVRMIPDLQVAAIFPGGTKLVTAHNRSV